MMKIMTKKCSVCMQNAKKLNLPLNSPLLPRHEGCLVNHDGSSKSMEALSCVAGLEEIYDQTNVAVYGIVAFAIRFRQIEKCTIVVAIHRTIVVASM